MQRIFSLVLSLIILVQSLGIGLNNLLQIDELFEHARFHQETYGDSLLTFFSKHYGDQQASHHQEHKEEHEQHEGLPLHFTGHSLQLMVTFFWKAQISFPTSSDVNPIENSNFHYGNLYHSRYSEGIFQPPKQA